MAIPVHLQQFKAAGIYRVVFDKSTIEGVDAETLRLVVGYSEKGPFNVPTYIKSVTDFVNIYGDISKKLEKRGIYFHRLAKQALSAGPILCLNLKKFSTESVDAVTVSTDFNHDGEGLQTVKLNVTDIYDTTRFWTLDATKLVGAHSSTSSAVMDEYINISATGEKATSGSVFIRKACGAKVSAYNITVSDWYKAEGESVPEFLEDKTNNLISDFFAEVYVFGAKFLPDQVLASSTLKNYFEVDKNDRKEVKLRETYIDAFGKYQDTLDALYADETSGAIGHYVGCLIPYFKDKFGAYQSLDIIFNSDQTSHNMMMAFDIDGLENNDGLVNIDLSGRDSVTKKLVDGLFNEQDDSNDYTNVLSNVKSKVVADKLAFSTNIDEIYLTFKENTSNIIGSMFVSNITENTEDHSYNFTISHIDDSKADSTDTLILTVADKAEYDQVRNALSIQEIVNEETGGVTGYYGGAYLKDTFNVDDSNDEYTMPELVITKISKIKEGPEEHVFTGTGSTIKFSTLSTVIKSDSHYVSGGKNAVYGTSMTFIPVNDENTFKDTENTIITTNDARFFNLIAEGECFVGHKDKDGNTQYIADDAKRPAVYVNHVTKKLNDTTGKYDYTIEFTDKPFVYNNGSKYYLVRIDKALNQEVGQKVKPAYLEGYEYVDSKPASTSMYDKLQWQKRILSALTDYRGLRTGLLNKSDIDYRYIIDTFESFVDSDLKDTLSYLALQKQSAFAILNFPSVKTFRKCNYSSFTDANNLFNVQYVVDGCNKKKSSAVRFSLPTDANGASFCAFYSPLKFSDGSLDSIIPSAGLVSNLFMQKYTSRQPYYIVAGPNYARISAPGLVGPDYNYSMDELQIIEPFGVNCMVYRPSFGTFINANQTAKQTPKSALSSVNVRELVIYLQDEIEKVLQAYQWEFNNATTRTAILDKANYICSLIQANGGIQAYKNVMDSSNNTPDIIDNEMAVLSTHIEPGRGCGKMVHELTLYRTGQMSSAVSD